MTNPPSPWGARPLPLVAAIRAMALLACAFLASGRACAQAPVDGRTARYGSSAGSYLAFVPGDGVDVDPIRLPAMQFAGAAQEIPDGMVQVGSDLVPIEDMYSDIMPLLVVDTEDGEEPTCEQVSPPEGCIGNGITNANKVKSSLRILLAGDTIYDSGDYEKDVSGMTIKIRGNSSAYLTKKSYKIKLQKKADLLHRGDDATYKDKEWVLLTNEKNLSNHYLGFMATDAMGCPWTPANEFVNVVMNGVYRGIYLLAEPVKRNADCRIDVDEDTGYIIEYDPYWWNEDVYFESSMESPEEYTFKYPDSDDVTQEQIDYIQGAVLEMEASLDGEDYPDYIDLWSFARWVLTHDLLGTYDSGGSNMFLSKYDNTDASKFKMETLWDFDSIERMEAEWANIHDRYCFGKLFGNDNTAFAKEYAALWGRKRESAIKKIVGGLDGIVESGLADEIDRFIPYDNVVSDFVHTSITDEIDAHKDWLTSRKAWLDEAIDYESALEKVQVGDSLVTLVSLRNEALPLIVITTNDAEEPTCDPVEAPEGCFGPGITNDDKVKAGMQVILGDETVYDSGEYEKDTSGLTIKVRGSSSAYLDKKSYKIKLQKKADLLNRGDDKKYKDKEWVLLTNEGYLTNDAIGFLVSGHMMGDQWTPACGFANVVMNGIYRGIYLLAEPVKQNEDCRIDVDGDSGYIIEYDPTWWNEDLYFESAWHDAMNYTFKQPDSDDVTEDQLVYIKGEVDGMEASILDGTYPERIDVESFARWVLTHDLLGTEGWHDTNMFLSKYDDTAGSKFRMETPWDFDSIERTVDGWSGPHLGDGFYFDALFGSGNAGFLKEYKTLWEEMSQDAVEGMISDLEAMKTSDLAGALDLYSGYDMMVSGIEYPSIATQVEESIEWLSSRKAWLDVNVPALVDGLTVLVGDSLVTLESLRNEALPLVIVDTEDSVDPTCDPIEAPEGCFGPGITNDDKVKGGMRIILGTDTLYDSGDYEKDKSGLTIKVRGGSSAYLDKKSYKVKLQKKADLLHRGNDDVYKDKEWVLLNNGECLANDYVGFLASGMMGDWWTPACGFANVVMNGRYKGIYLLAESVKRNEDCRIDVDGDNGYIIEYDPTWWNEDLYFESAWNDAMNYTFKQPDPDDVTVDQLAYIKGEVDGMEASILDGTYPEHIDVASFARWCLAHDLLGTGDWHDTNMFLSKYDSTPDSKFCMETPWDFDSMERTVDGWSGPHLDGGFYLDALFGSSNTEFLAEYKALWEEMSGDAVGGIIAALEELKASDLALAIDLYSGIDGMVSGIVNPSFSAQVDGSIEWFTSRKAWLDENIPALVDGLTVLVGDSLVALKDFVNESVPLLVVNTVDSEEPTYEPVSAPEGCLGSSITNATKVKGRLVAILGNDTIYDSGDYEKDVSGMTIKVRGNSSAYLPQKPYKIKLQKDADLLHRGNDDVFKDKEWVLLTSDNALTNNMVGFLASGLVTDRWTPACGFVNVVMNGIYRGIYLLSESVERNVSCRIDVDEDAGYIIEYDPYWWNEDVYFESDWISTMNYTFKYPDSDDVTEGQVEYIQAEVADMEASMRDGTYPDRVDVGSFAGWVLAHDLLGTYDEAGSNLFLSKYDSGPDSKFFMETPWDFDSIEMAGDGWATIHGTDGFYYGRLFASDNPEFVQAYKDLWETRSGAVVDGIIDALDAFLDSGVAKALERYRDMNHVVSLWDYPGLPEEIDAHKEWFTARKAWLDEHVPDLYEASGIGRVYALPGNDGNAAYDLLGRRVGSHAGSGIVIRNGKKHISR